jgi:hypothetical protein
VLACVSEGGIDDITRLGPWIGEPGDVRNVIYFCVVLYFDVLLALCYCFLLRCMVWLLLLRRGWMDIVWNEGYVLFALLLSQESAMRI